MVTEEIVPSHIPLEAEQGALQSKFRSRLEKAGFNEPSPQSKYCKRYRSEEAIASYKHITYQEIPYFSEALMS
jgi:hypothetical protein